jgi:CheY-like chemotaxis protein
MASIVVVDDEPKTRDVLELILRQAGHAVCTAASGHEALAHMRAGDMDVLLSDVKMPHMDGRPSCDRSKRKPAMWSWS